MTLSRRTALKLGIASALASAAEAPGQSISRGSLRVGAPVFLKTEDPVLQAREHRRRGLSAAYCPDFASLSDPKLLRQIENSFLAENVVIAEVGAWRNILDPDSEKRKTNLEYVVQRCALADEVGARCCVDVAGSFNKDVWFGPDPRNLSPEFFELTVQNCRYILDQVKPKRTRFTLEIIGWNIPDGPDSYLDLLRAVGRDAFGVHLDVCNGINSPRKFYENAAFIRECFRKLGPWIVSCHGKDLTWVVELNVHFKETLPGKGLIDYGVYLGEIARLHKDVPLMLEHLSSAEEYDEALKYVEVVAKSQGIELA